MNPQAMVGSPKTPRRRKPRDKVLIRVARGPKIEFKRRQSGDISLNHHEAHCAICQHPERDLIEQAFLHWQRSSSIAYEFQLADRRVVYRHARAFGLYRRRAARSRRALEFIMEQAETVTATADSVIRAVKAHACLSEDGHWTEPVKRVVITHEYANCPDPQMTRLDEVASLAGCRLAAPPAKSAQPPQKAAVGTGKSLGTPAERFSRLTPAPPTKLPKFLGTLAHRITMGILRANNVSRRISPHTP